MNDFFAIALVAGVLWTFVVRPAIHIRNKQIAERRRQSDAARVQRDLETAREARSRARDRWREEISHSTLEGGFVSRPGHPPIATNASTHSPSYILEDRSDPSPPPSRNEEEYPTSSPARTGLDPMDKVHGYYGMSRGPFE